MPITMKDVVRSLMPDEADLHQAAKALGPDALPRLAELVRSPDVMLASKAAYVAGLIPDPRAIKLLEAASDRAEKAVRVAVATTARFLSAESVGALLGRLLTDPDPEIRRIAVESTPPQAVPDVINVLEMLALTDPYDSIRTLSAQLLARRQDVKPH